MSIIQRGRFISVFLVILFCCAAGLVSGCDRPKKRIVVYSGKGLEMPMEEIRRTFESRYPLQVDIIYAGSETLLETIRRTGRGDVFIPGSFSYIQDADDLVLSRQYVAKHVLAFAVRKDNPKNIRTLEDLRQPGLKIAVGNKEMCAAGRISEGILGALAEGGSFISNIAITGTTVNELLDLVVQKEVDAAIVWSDMMLWPAAGDLVMIEIPGALNKAEEIQIAVLTTTRNRKNAALFTDFVARESKAVFMKYGFGD